MQAQPAGREEGMVYASHLRLRSRTPLSFSLKTILNRFLYTQYPKGTRALLGFTSAGE